MSKGWMCMMTYADDNDYLVIQQPMPFRLPHAAAERSQGTAIDIEI